jgi:Zn-dependent M28 family amino/carboxypeptidase
VFSRLALAWCATALPLQEQPLEAYRGTVERILRAALEQGQAYELLGELCQVAPNRLSGSAGAARAVEWARERMVAAGFEEVRLEPCSVPRWERGAGERLVVRLAGEDAPVELPILALGGSVATPAGGLSAGVIEVHGFEELRARAGEAAGRIVFFNRPMETGCFDTFDAYGGAVDQRSRGASEAARAGALAVVVRSMTARIDDFPHTGSLHYAEDQPRIPAAAVSTRGAEQLSAWIAAGREPRLTLSLSCAWHADVESFNVVGELRGSERPEELVVVGGHLDAWDVGQGAHDDGAGCMQAFEVLRLLKALDLRPRRTLRAVLFMNEENGTRGAQAYREAHAAELERHVLALESDRGGFTPLGFTSDAAPPAFAVLRGIVDLMEPARIDRLEAGHGGVDIAPLAAHGVPLVGLLPDPQRYFDVHHSANDTFDQVNERELELGAGAMAALCFVVADLPEALPRNPPAESR